MTYQARGNIACVECGNPKIVGRKLCRRCYSRAWKAGTLDAHKLLGPEDVFETRINKTPTCWLWTGTKNDYGYGIFLLPGEKAVRAHRYAYEFFVGPIPDGMIVLHKCDNPPCVNPKHLRIGTKDENNKDTGMKRRHNYGLDHWNGRLAPTDVAAIRISDEPQSVLAKRYGVHQSYISRVRTGKRRV